MLVSLLCLFVYLVASFPLLWLVWMQPCGWGHILVMLACLPLSFLSLVCLYMLEFLMIALCVPYNMIIFILVWQHALPLLCLLALCCVFLAFVCIFVYMFMHVSLCSCCIIKHCSYPWSRVGSHSSLYTRSRVPFRNLAWWHKCHLCSNIIDLWMHIQTPICPSRTPFVCLFVW